MMCDLSLSGGRMAVDEALFAALYPPNPNPGAEEGSAPAPASPARAKDVLSGGLPLHPAFAQLYRKLGALCSGV